MRLLVAGADRVDAGKTTFATGLLATLPPETLGVKPRAGNDLWFDHDDARRALSAGRLYGKDAARLVAATGGDERPEAVNPIHRLWQPTPDRTGMLGERGRTFLADRVTTPTGPEYVVNATVDLPERVREALPVADAERVASVAEFNDAMRRHHLPALARLAERVRESDPVVVESYADVADPLRGVDGRGDGGESGDDGGDDGAGTGGDGTGGNGGGGDGPDRTATPPRRVAYDAVAVVEPRRCRVFDGRRWQLACDAVGNGGGRLEERVGSVAGHVDPLGTVPLRPLTGEERDDPAAVADAYADAYDALVEAARGGARPDASAPSE
ncbi:ATPase [Halobaculum sp. MBLA0147]|uniref:ATPase n=1 Tax=Halobaculum sp. MBLA0147 TaxID=3079934 RepID=UPI003525CCC0